MRLKWSWSCPSPPLPPALYDNNRSSSSGCAEPRLIAKKDVGDSELVVLDPQAFQAFRAVGRVNIDAACVEGLYGGQQALAMEVCGCGEEVL